MKPCSTSSRSSENAGGTYIGANVPWLGPGQKRLAGRAAAHSPAEAGDCSKSRTHNRVAAPQRLLRRKLRAYWRDGSEDSVPDDPAQRFCGTRAAVPPYEYG